MESNSFCTQPVGKIHLGACTCGLRSIKSMMASLKISRVMFKKQLIKVLNNVVKYARKNESQRESPKFVKRLSWSNINIERNFS